MNLSQKLFIAAALCFALVIAEAAKACSVVVNDLSQKNMLVALSASHLDISMDKITSIHINDYERSLTGGEGSSCPDSLETEARVSFKYSPRVGENCDATVTIHRSQFMGELEDLTGSFDESEFSEMTAACSTSIVLVRPLKPIPRPVILPKKP